MEFIVGTVFGGIPIVLEAYDRYWQMSAAFSTFRNSSTELMKLETTLRTQKTLFRGNALKLLAAITRDPETAKDLMSDTDSPKWGQISMSEESHDRVEGLREEISSWMATAMQIKLCLGSLCRELDGLRDTANTDPTHVQSADSRRKVLKRFNLVWKKPEILKAIRELREFTADHNDLTGRLVIGLQEVSSVKSSGETRSHLSVGSQRSLERYRYIRDASRHLYDTLANHWSCACPLSHVANICLIKERENITSDNVVNFELTIDTADWLATSKGPLWLEVKLVDPASPPAGEAKDPSADRWMDQLTLHSKPYVLETIEKQKARKLTKKTTHGVTGDLEIKVKETTKEPIQVGQESAVATTSTGMAFQSLDMGKIGDFCAYFRKTVSPCLATCTCCQAAAHRFEKHHMLLQSLDRLCSGQPKSLTDVIVWVAEDELSRSISRIGILHLAAGLASAVLQFYSTPWLRENWQSRDVRFYADAVTEGDGGSAIEQSDPFLSIKLEALTNAGELRDESGYGLARNEMLFRLGIVMLELGYSKPWVKLREMTLAKLSSRKQTDYHAAEILAKACPLREKMGPRYATVIRKCLGCDFGLGENDLDDKELQGTFLSDVILVLQEAETDLKRLDQRLKDVK